MEEDSDLSSCSFATDNEDVQLDQCNSVDIQKLTLQIEREKDINRQLQASLDNSKKQLKEALDTVAQSSAIKDQIRVLQQQLNEANERNEKLNEELRKSTTTDTATTKLNEQIAIITQDRDQALTKNQILADQIFKLRQDKAKLKEAAFDNQELLKQCADENDELKERLKKLGRKNSNLRKAAEQLQATIDQDQIEMQKAINEKTTLQQEIDSLKLQLSTAAQQNNESQNALNTLQKEVTAKATAVNLLEAQLESQRDEMNDMTKDKQKIISLLQRMNCVLSASEIKIESLKKENVFLQSKQSQRNPQGSLVSKNDIFDLTIPFEGDVADDCEKIMKLPQYQPIQRIQLILNEAAKHINDCEDEVKSIKHVNSDLVTELEDNRTRAQEYSQILNSLLTDLKAIAITDSSISRSSPCINDPAFVSLVANKCAQIDPLFRDRVMSEPHFISNDFFFTDDVTKRKKEIQMIAEQSDTTFAILSSLFLVNNILRRQVEQLNALKENAGASQLPGQQPNASMITDVSLPVDVLAANPEKIAKLKKSQKQLQAALKRSQQQQMELNKADNELKMKIAQLQIQNESLQNDIDVLTMKLQVANNELAVKQGDQSNISTLALQIKDNMEDARRTSDAKNMKLEEEIMAKNNEIAQLNSTIRQMQDNFEAELEQQAKQAKKRNEYLVHEIEKLNGHIDEMEYEKEQRRKSSKRKERQAKHQNEAVIAQITAQYEESKASLNETIENLKEKSKTAHDMYQKLIESMAELEAKNKAMLDENTALQAKQKSVQVELSSIKQTMQKEKQTLQNQLSAQAMVYESKIQKAMKDAKAEAQKIVDDLLNTAFDTFGTHYGIDECDMCEDGFKQLIGMIKADLDKLKYFQEENTKFQGR